MLSLFKKPKVDIIKVKEPVGALVINTSSEMLDIIESSDCIDSIMYAVGVSGWIVKVNRHADFRQVVNWIQSFNLNLEEK